MILTADIGNTNITFGIFRGNKIIKKFDIPTKFYTAFSLKNKLKGFLFRESIICSVVPKKTNVLSRDLKDIT
ncbi:MAG: type III pantothenate kinase, partial [Candidatus Omnitrophota bacterium]